MCGIRRGRPRDGGALVRRRSRAVAVLPGAQSIVVGHREERGARQSSSCHGTDRTARRGAVLADRAAERDGRARGGWARQPAVRASRPRRSCASRRDRGAVGRGTTCPAKPGLTAVELFDALAAGSVKMVWIACTNPAQSLPDQATVREGLARAELVVLQEAYANTETARVRRRAAARDDVGREGRYGHQLRAPHLARTRGVAAAWRGARRLGASRSRSRAASKRACGRGCRPLPVPIRRPRSSTSTRRRPAAAISTSPACRMRVLDAHGPAAVAVPRRRFARRGARCTPITASRPPDGRARFAAVDLRTGGRARRCALSVSSQHRPVARPVARHEPHRHRRRSSLRMRREPAVELHPADLARRGLAAGDLVQRRIAARQRRRADRGERESPARAVRFLPMHWGSAALARRGERRASTRSPSRRVARSPKQPELKHAAVRIAKVDLPWRLVRVRLSGQRTGTDRAARQAARALAARPGLCERRADRR